MNVCRQKDQVLVMPVGETLLELIDHIYNVYWSKNGLFYKPFLNNKWLVSSKSTTGP